VNLKLTSLAVVIVVAVVPVMSLLYFFLKVFVLLVLRHVPRFCHTFSPISRVFFFIWLISRISLCAPFAGYHFLIHIWRMRNDLNYTDSHAIGIVIGGGH